MSALRTMSRFSAATVPSRTFATMRVLRAGKESKPSDEGRKSEIERVKNEQLREQKEGKNSWKEDIASDSESVVKADRGEIKNAKDTIAQLQKEGARAAQAEKDGK